MTYVYSIQTNFPNGINTTNLADEIRLSSIPVALNYINTNGDEVSIVFKDSLADTTVLDQVVANHDYTDKTPPPVIFKVQEEYVKTNEIYKAQAQYITGTTGTTFNDFTWDHGINVMCVQIRTEDENRGDVVKMYVMAPNDGILGYAAQSGVTGETGVYVSSLIANNIYPGEEIILEEGAVKQYLGGILSIDKTNNILYFKNGVTNSFSTSAFVKHRRNVLDPFYLGPADKYILGECKIGGAYIPAGYTVRVEYVNNGNTAKSLYTIIEYLY